MLDTLAGRLQSTFGRLGRGGRISGRDLDAALREVRIALLEADVNFRVVRDFVARVRERAAGAEVLQSITPGQQVIGVVHEELVAILGGGQEPLLRAASGPTKVLVCGAQGAGKTTLAARLALHLREDGLRPLLVATDFQRAAASEQLRALGDRIGVPVYAEEREAPVAAVAGRALAEARRGGATAVVVDTRGAVALDDAFADELGDLADAIDPTEVLIAVDAMSGQEAAALACDFDDAVEGTGVVVTKVDSDTRGGAVLSVREVTGLPIKFLTTGERLEALEVFHPDRFASRILGMGDVVSLVEKAKATIGERDMKEVARRMQRGEFDLEDFLAQMRQVREMGPLSGLLDMLPGAGRMKQQLRVPDMDEDFWRHHEAMILSMTPRERRRPEIIDGSRRRRIAAGSGMQPADVNRLLNQYREAKKLMQAVTGGKGSGGIGRLLGL